MTTQPDLFAGAPVAEGGPRDGRGTLKMCLLCMAPTYRTWEQGCPTCDWGSRFFTTLPSGRRTLSKNPELCRSCLARIEQGAGGRTCRYCGMKPLRTFDPRDKAATRHYMFRYILRTQGAREAEKYRSAWE